MGVPGFFYLPVSLFMLVLFDSVVTQYHRDTREVSILGKMLQKHIFKTITGASFGDVCLRECYRDIRCQSFNYVFTQDKCELSNRTKETRPEDFVPSSERYYFRRDTKRAILGAIPELPADSCKEIKASEGGKAVSGKYWLNFIIHDTPVLAHCDMKTEDADECNTSIRICDKNADCKNTLDSYRCSCKTGFSGDGHTCKDIDECASSVHGCHDLALCTNTVGSFNCSCHHPYEGDGRSCNFASLSAVPSCKALGVEDPDIIPDAQIIASSNYLSYNPTVGRLNGDRGWCQQSSKITNDYIQVDMGAGRTVCGVATQGKANGSFIKSYRLSFSTDGTSWTTYKEQNIEKIFEANSDLNTIVEHTLNSPVQAKYIRFYPVTFSQYPCMRIEVFVQ